MNTHLTRIDNIIQDITYLAEEIREEQGGRSNEITTRLRRCASDLDDVADLIADSPEDDDDDDFVPLSSIPKRTVRESDEEQTEWFDSNGDMKKHLPMDCILDCSRGGRNVDDDVDYWVNELNFHVPTEKGLNYIQEYGLDAIGSEAVDKYVNPEVVDKYVLWIMCGNIKEEAYEFCRGGMDYEDFETSEYPEEIDDWTERDWDNFQSEVAICHLGM